MYANEYVYNMYVHMCVCMYICMFILTFRVFDVDWCVVITTLFMYHVWLY